jgi:uracil-DNA glycosylase family 4
VASAEGRDRGQVRGARPLSSGLATLREEVVTCRRCPRLVAWREEVARVKRAAFASETYWGRPIPGFGDPAATVLVLGLAPAAHGGNRTGRVFAALHAVGMASQPTSRSVGDGLILRGCWVSAAVRCAPPANRPTPAERDTCLPFAVRELALLGAVRAIVCLGGFAWDAALRILAAGDGAVPRPKPRFGHGAEVSIGERVLLGCYHPSQQNTFTGRLAPGMMEDVLRRAQALVAS